MQPAAAVSPLARFILGFPILAAIPGTAWAQGTFFVVDGSAGVNTSTPQATLQVQESDSQKHNRVLLRLTGSSFAPQAEYEDGSTGVIWRFGMNPNNDFVINDTADLGTAEMRISVNGEVYVNGTQVHPDYVFSPDYALRPVEDLAAYVRENEHLPGVLTSAEREHNGGIDLASFPLQLLEKIEELTLYTIDQQKLIHELQTKNEALTRELRSSNEELAARIAALERAQDER